MIVVVIRVIFFAIFAFASFNTNLPSAMAVQRHSLYSKRQAAGLTLRYGTVLLLISNRFRKHSYRHECARILPSQCSAGPIAK